MAGFITKTDTGYRARWRTPEGQSRSKTFRRKVDAEMHLTDMANQVLSGTYVDPSAGRMTLAEWVPLWRAASPTLRPSTTVSGEMCIERYILPTFGPTALRDITYMAVSAWVTSLTTVGPKLSEGRSPKPLAPATAKKAYQILCKLMSMAVQAKRIQVSPCAGVKLPKIEKKEMRFLSTVEVEALADAMDPHYAPIVTFGAYSGLRAGEMFGLRANRIDWVNNRVRVEEILTEVAGKMYVGAPKTNAGKRWVPLPAKVMAMLRSMPLPDESNGYVFRTKTGRPIRLSRFRNDYWVPALKKSGIGHTRVHDLRHTAVSFWIAVGAAPNDIASWAGHTSAVTVIDVYGHKMPHSEAEAMSRLDTLSRLNSVRQERVIGGMGIAGNESKTPGEQGVFR